MKAQPWECKRCKKSGMIQFDAEAGMMEVILLLTVAHIDASPNCDADDTNWRCTLPMQYPLFDGETLPLVRKFIERQ